MKGRRVGVAALICSALGPACAGAILLFYELGWEESPFWMVPSTVGTWAFPFIGLIVGVAGLFYRKNRILSAVSLAAIAGYLGWVYVFVNSVN
jgi:hypothetical protein